MTLNKIFDKLKADLDAKLYDQFNEDSNFQDSVLSLIDTAQSDIVRELEKRIENIENDMRQTNKSHFEDSDHFKDWKSKKYGAIAELTKLVNDLKGEVKQ